MNLKSKIIIAVYLIIAGLVLYFAYGVVKERYFTPHPEEETHSLWEKFYPKEKPEEVDEEKADEDFEEEIPEEEIEFLEITTEDCDNECVGFEEASDLEYCRQVCGLVPLSEIQQKQDECDKFDGLKKDYCLKDLAVSKKDFAICEKIKDKNIKKICQNRITEELLNGMEAME